MCSCFNTFIIQFFRVVSRGAVIHCKSKKFLSKQEKRDFMTLKEKFRTCVHASHVYLLRLQSHRCGDQPEGEQRSTALQQKPPHSSRGYQQTAVSQTPHQAVKVWWNLRSFYFEGEKFLVFAGKSASSMQTAGDGSNLWATKANSRRFSVTSLWPLSLSNLQLPLATWSGNICHRFADWPLRPVWLRP